MGVGVDDEAWLSIGADDDALCWVALVGDPSEADEARQQGASMLLAWPDAAGLFESTVELALRQTHERLGFQVMRKAVRMSPAWVEITEPDITWWEVSEGFEDGTGYRRDEVIGRTPAEVLRSSVHSPAFFRQLQAQVRGEPGHWRGDMLSQRRDGGLAITDTLVAAILVNGRPAAQFASRRHNQARTAGSMYDRLETETRRPWWLARRADGVVLAHHAGLPDLLAGERELLGHPLRELGLCDVLPGSGQRLTSDRWLGGRAYEQHCHGLVVGEVELVLGVLDDITERKLEAERREAMVHDLKVARDQALAAGQAKSAFLAAMSHDLRTPLNAILGYTELLKEDLADPEARPGPEQLDDLSRVAGAGRHLLGLVDDVLDLARVEAGAVDIEHDWIDGAELLEQIADTVRLRASARRMQLTVTVDGHPVYSDARRVRQVLTNLVSNAVKYAVEGRVQLVQRGHSFHVVDDGPGLDDAQLQSIFQPFHRLQAGGSGVGLGLAISRRLAEALGGTLEAGRDGTGTRFTLSLPAPPDGAARGPAHG